MVLPVQSGSQQYNPEVPWIPPATPNIKVTEIVEKLRHVKQVS